MRPAHSRRAAVGEGLRVRSKHQTYRAFMAQHEKECRPPPRKTDIQEKSASSRLGLWSPVRSMPMAAPMQVAVAVTSMPVTVAKHAAMPIVMMVVPTSMREMKLAAERLDRRRGLSRKR